MRKKYSDNPYLNPPPDFDQLIEIYDDYGQTLFLTNLDNAIRRKMPRSMVQVIITAPRGKYLIRQRAVLPDFSGPGLWDLSAVAPVMAGQSRQGAALKAVRDCLGLLPLRLREIGTLPYQDEAGGKLSATFFMSEPSKTAPSLNPSLSSDYMLLDRDELTGLSQAQPDLLTPELAWAIRSGWIWPGN